MTVDNRMSKLWDAMLPGRCLLCHSAVRGRPLCPGCEASLPWIANPCRGCAMPLSADEPGFCADCLRSSPPFDLAWAAFRLAAPVQGLVHGLKYSARFSGAGVLGALAARRLAQRPEPLPELLIPVPLHHRRLWLRGYNQAQELARAIAKLLAVPVATRAAVRVRATADQIGKTAPQRRRNLKDAFEIRLPLQGLHVALLDDVMTTGATLAELARSCRKAGARKVEAWAIARAT
jgi:ComF family protein